jgi:hypothetical protein
VKSSGLSNDSEVNFSLLHPVFKELMGDKNKSDSLGEIQEIEKMIKCLNGNKKN